MKIYILISVILAVLSFIYLKLAVKYRIIDKPNERSSHTKVTVRGGGIIFPIAILLFFFFNDYQYPYFVFGVFLISLVSFLDDIYTLTSKIRFPFQFAAVGLVLFQLDIPLEVLVLLYVFLGIGVINLFNFMDGINGVTGLYSMAVLSVFYFINLNEEIINSELIIYTLISLFLFGFYNFRKKAIFFAGDIGSVSIGTLIFFIGLYFAVSLNSPLIILAIIVYGADTGCTFLYRKLFTNESVFEPHRHHIYQKLVDVKKFSHLTVSLSYAVVQLLMNIVLYKSYHLQLQTQLFILLGIISFFMLIYLFLFHRLKVKS